MRATAPRLPIVHLTLVPLILLFLAGAAAAEDEAPWSSDDFSGLAFREIGPAIASGRVGDFAVDPRNPHHWYVGVNSGGVWETKNAGVTFEPIFDDQDSYSIGCLALAPSAPDILSFTVQGSHGIP